MVFPFTIDSVTDQGGGKYLLSTKNTYYLQSGENRFMTIDSVVYTVEEIVLNESVIVSGSTVPPTISFNLPAPFFFHGTIRQTNEDLKGLSSDMNDKTPMVYLLRPFSELTDALDLNDPTVERTPDLTIFFLTQCKFHGYNTEEQDHHAIEPMASMMQCFIDTMKKSKKIGSLGNYTSGDRMRFGTYVQNGQDKAYWSDELSGKELNISVPIYTECCTL